jgi:hypothetical protein
MMPVKTHSEIFETAGFRVTLSGLSTDVALK